VAPNSDAPLAWMLACIIVTPPARLVALPFLDHHLTVQAEHFVLRNARSVDLVKAHEVFL
jgi:hypothetical protein